MSIRGRSTRERGRGFAVGTVLPCALLFCAEPAELTCDEEELFSAARWHAAATMMLRTEMLRAGTETPEGLALGLQGTLDAEYTFCADATSVSETNEPTHVLLDCLH